MKNQEERNQSYEMKPGAIYSSYLTMNNTNALALKLKVYIGDFHQVPFSMAEVIAALNARDLYLSIVPAEEYQCWKCTLYAKRNNTNQIIATTDYTGLAFPDVLNNSVVDLILPADIEIKG